MQKVFTVFLSRLHINTGTLSSRDACILSDATSAQVDKHRQFGSTIIGIPLIKSLSHLRMLNSNLTNKCGFWIRDHCFSRCAAKEAGCEGGCHRRNRKRTKSRLIFFKLTAFYPVFCFLFFLLLFFKIKHLYSLLYLCVLYLSLKT